MAIVSLWLLDVVRKVFFFSSFFCPSSTLLFLMCVRMEKREEGVNAFSALSTTREQKKNYIVLIRGNVRAVVILFNCLNDHEQMSVSAVVCVGMN